MHTEAACCLSTRTASASVRQCLEKAACVVHFCVYLMRPHTPNVSLPCLPMHSSLISACEKAGRWELALELFNKMNKENCKPNVVTFNSLIAACAHGAHACVARAYLSLAPCLYAFTTRLAAALTCRQIGRPALKCVQAEQAAARCHPN